MDDGDGNSGRDLRKEVRQLQLRGWKSNFMLCCLLGVTLCKYGQLVTCQLSILGDLISL